MSSGFDADPSAYSAARQLPRPGVSNIKQGKTGEFLVQVTPVGRGAKHYQLRHAEEGTDPLSNSWTIEMLASARAAVCITGLTPGKIYVFQVRAYGKLGYTDWSDSVSRMCT